jgi:ATP-dependent Lon protease
MLLAKELEVLELEDQIHSRVQQEMDRSQREHFLREQMRVIQGELGEGDLFSQEITEVREMAAAKQLPDEVRAKMDKEIARLGAMPPMSPEVGIIRTYIDWVLSLPWLDTSEDNLDVSHAAEVLDNDHYGLEKVKDRTSIEFTALSTRVFGSDSSTYCRWIIRKAFSSFWSCSYVSLLLDKTASRFIPKTRPITRMKAPEMK